MASSSIQRILPLAHSRLCSRRFAKLAGAPPIKTGTESGATFGVTAPCKICDIPLNAGGEAMSMKSISIEEAVRLCKQIPTLVIGPAASYHINWSTTLAREVVSNVPGISAPSSDVDIETLIDLIKQRSPEHLYDAISYCKARISGLQAPRSVQELAAGQ